MRRSRSTSPIGIDVGSRWIHAAQLARAGDDWRLHATARIPRIPDASLDAEAERLASILERRGFLGDAAVLAAPPGMLLTSVLELPPRTSGAPVAQLAAAELGRMHKCDPGAMEVALWEVPAANRAASGCEYMVAACAHEASDALLDAFENAGLEVRALDLLQLALLRACASGIRPPPAMDALLHLGWDRCSLMIVTDGVIAYERALEGAEGKALVTTIAQRLDADLAAIEEILTGRLPEPSPESREHRRELETEIRDFTTAHVAALVEQVHTSFAYVSRRYTDRDLGTVTIAGEFGALEGLSTRLATLGVEARTARAHDAVRSEQPDAEADLGPSIIGAIGLAMHEQRGAA